MVDKFNRRLEQEVKAVLKGEGTLASNIKQTDSKKDSKATWVEPNKGDKIEDFAGKLCLLKNMIGAKVDNIYGDFDGVMLRVDENLDAKAVEQDYKSQKMIAKNSKKYTHYIKDIKNGMKKFNIDQPVALEGFCGTHISNFANDLVEVKAVQLSKVENVYGMFNDTILRVDKHSTQESILKDFDDQREISLCKYINSDEYKKNLEKDKIEVEKLNVEFNELVKQYEKVDIKDYEQVVKFLANIQPYTDDTRIITRGFTDKVLKDLKSSGYKANENCGEAFRENDKENFGRYLIGQGISGLEEIGAIHHMMVYFTEKWDNKFNKQKGVTVSK